MKPLVLLLAASLVANAAFVAVSLRRDSDAEAATVSSSATTRPGVSASSSASAAKGSAPADIVAALKADDPAALRDLLRAAGLPDETVRNLVSSAVWARYRDRMKALQPKPEPNTAWWKNDQNNWFGNLTREQRAEQRRLQREANDAVTALLGPSKDNYGWGWPGNRLAFIAEDKRMAFQEIEQDYQDLIMEVQQDMQGFQLPSDQEKIRFLEEEKMRDLAAILTPQELADYELRMSKTANQLRWKMTRFDGTEEEYRKVFALQKTFDSTQQTDAWGNPINQNPDGWKQRQEAQKQLDAQIKEALGADRYAEYVRSQNHEYQQLTAAAKRLDLPPGTATQVFNLRNDIASESKLIADNESLGLDQKKQALAALAQKTRDQVRASLGAEAADVYLKGSMNWLNSLENGQLVTFSETGQFNGSRPLPQPPKKPAPKAAN